MQYSFHGKIESVIYFDFCCCVLLFDFLKYASLCNLIKLVNIFCKYAANDQKLFSKD